MTSLNSDGSPKSATNFLDANFHALAMRSSNVANILKSEFSTAITEKRAKDGGIYLENQGADGAWHAITNSLNPIETAQKSINLMAQRLLGPKTVIVIAGLGVGYVIDTVYRFLEKRKGQPGISLKIAVIADSAEILFWWMSSGDRRSILSDKDVELILPSDVETLVNHGEGTPKDIPHFATASELPETEAERLLAPIAGHLR